MDIFKLVEVREIMDVAWNPAIEKESFTDAEIADNNSIAWEEGSMIKQQAYKIVFDDLMFSGPMTFRGIFDAVNGNKEFMYGICTVMEYIANNSDEENYKKFNKMFIHNMIASQDGGCFE